MIPLIDCSPIAEGSFENVDYADFTKVADELGRAMTGIGMCNLINHGVSIEKVRPSLILFCISFFVKHPLIICCQFRSKRCTRCRKHSLNYRLRRS